MWHNVQTWGFFLKVLLRDVPQGSIQSVPEPNSAVRREIMNLLSSHSVGV